MKALARQLPPRVQRAIRIGMDPPGAIERHRILRRLASRPDVLPTRAVLQRLCTTWGGGGVGTASLELEACRQAQAATRPILECGSGLSTLLMGIYARVPLVSLEESLYWQQRMQAAIAWYCIPNVEVFHAPIVDYGGFRWFKVPPDLPPQFGLVFVDGPEAHHNQGLPRYGVAEVLADAIDDGTVIVLDDAERESEVATLDRWRELGLREQRLLGDSRQYAIVSR